MCPRTARIVFAAALFFNGYFAAVAVLAAKYLRDSGLWATVVVGLTVGSPSLLCLLWYMYRCWAEDSVAVRKAKEQVTQ